MYCREDLSHTFDLRDGKVWRKVQRRNQFGDYGKCHWRKVSENKPNSQGYLQIRFNKTVILYQHIVWILSGNTIPSGYVIDHINGVRTDNRIENLRAVSRRANCQNQEIHRKGKTVGVRFESNKWRADISINKDGVYLGRFKTEAEASDAYQKAVKHLSEYKGNAEDFRNYLTETR